MNPKEPPQEVGSSAAAQEKPHKQADAERPSFEAEGKTAISRLRLLDFDDLFLLTHLLGGQGVAQTARQLGLTQPAITQRVRKIERVFDEAILTKVGRHVKLTKIGRAICLRAQDALAMMREVTSEPSGESLVVGSAPSVAQRWLWPVLRELHIETPRQMIHCVVGAGEELVGLLDSGNIQACLTSAAAPSGPFGVIEIGEAEYVMVAAPSLGATLRTAADLKAVLLLELDRSFPLFSRIERDGRSTLRFADVWYLGSVGNVVEAAVSGFGVAILPESLAGAPLSAGKLVQVLPEIDVVPERFRLIYRREKDVEPIVVTLADRLKKLTP